MLDREWLERVTTWEPWFAWYPVRLLTYEVAWLRWVKRRPAVSGQHMNLNLWDYCNP